MIRQYQYFSTGFNCNVRLSYSDGLLQAAEIENPQADYIKEPKAFFITHEDVFLKSCSTHKIDIVQIDRDVTFDMFWAKYDYKQSGKAPALKAWEKLTKEEQLQAFDYIPAYNSHLKQKQTAKKYGSSYLNSKIFIQ